MNTSEILTHVDHTQLKAYAGWEDIIRLCEEAIRLKTASVCVPPCYVPKIRESFGEQVRICTVVGFPLGYSVTEAKVAEVKKRWRMVLTKLIWLSISVMSKPRFYGSGGGNLQNSGGLRRSCAKGDRRNLLSYGGRKAPALPDRDKGRY